MSCYWSLHCGSVLALKVDAIAHGNDAVQIKLFLGLNEKSDLMPTDRQTRLHSSRMRTAACCPYLTTCTAPGGVGVPASGPGGSAPGGCLLQGVCPSMQWGSPSPTEFLTHASENITLPQLHCGR